MRLWDLTDLHHPRAQATLTGHGGGAWPVAFSPDGHTLATSNTNNTVQLWETDINRITTHICDVANP